jgi:hypothetical protein
MKKIAFILLLTISLVPVLQAQKEINITATTSATFISGAESFSFTEPVTLVVDVSGVPALVGVEPLYIWGFIQGCCSASTNGDWTASNEASRMTKVSDNVWSYSIPSVKAYVGASYKQAKDAAKGNSREETETRFGFLIKAKDGSGSPEKKSGDMEVAFTGPVYIKVKFENFPINPAQNDVLTLVYNQDKEDVEAMKSVTEVYLHATADLTAGGTKTHEEAVKLTKNGTRYTITFIPERFFALAPGQTISRIRVTISAADEAVNFGPEKTVNIVTVK